MKATATLTASLGLALGSLHAQTVPPFINYQGKVTDSAGLGLGTGTPVNRKVIFRIFDAATGGERLWSEQHTVTISNGEFSVLLGNGINANYAGADETPLKTATPLDTVFTSSGILRYVEIVVDNGDNTLNAGDAPIAPRQQITSTAYSFRARSADTIASGNDLQLNGSANYGLGYYGATRLFNGSAIDGPVLFGQAGGALGSVNGGTKNIALRWNENGAVGIGSADLSGASALTKLVLQGDDANTAPLQLNIRGNSDTNKRLLLGYNTSSNYGSLQAYSGISTATNLLLNPAGGNVGIGTASTPSKLTIASVGNDYGLTIVGASTAPGLTMQNNYPGGQKFSMFVGSTNPGSVQGLSIFDGNAAAYRFVIKSDGNVGIGTTTPSGKLDVNGDMYAGGARSGSRFWFTGNQIQQYSNEVAAAMHLNLSGGNVLLCGSASAGNVGIGLSAPDHKLDVSGNARISGNLGLGAAPSKGKIHIVGGQTSTGNIGWYLASSGVSNGNNVSLTAEYGLWTDRNIAGNAFWTFSDQRIKGVVGRSDAGKDLEMLKNIEITDYTYIDKIAKGPGQYKKVIAQQVETVYPQAVTRSTSEVPDIYRKATVKDGWVKLVTNLKKGERVQIMGEKTQGIHEVLEVEADRFRTAFATEENEVFVYGREVQDFRSVDYEAISMLNVSATQELARKLDEKDTQIAELQKRLAALETKDKARDAKLSAIEASLRSPAKAATVSPKQGE